MITPREFMDFVEGLKNPVVQMHKDDNPTLRTINLMTLTKDLLQYDDFRRWWKSKNMPPHLNNAIANTILDLNPPDNIKSAMLFMML